MRNRVIVFLCSGIFVLPLALQSQDKPAIPLEKFYTDRRGHPIRKILKPFKFSVSSGFGHTYFRHNLDGFGIYQSSTAGPYIFYGSTPPPTGHSQWIDTNKPIPITVNPGDLVVTSEDEKKLGFKSKSLTVPLKLTMHYEFKQFRVGLGYAKDFIFIKPFEPIALSDQIRSVRIGPGSVSTNKWFLLAGYSFYRINKFVFTGDLQGGLNKFGKNFDRNFVKASPFINAGVLVEYDMSEYLRFFIRPNYEIKSYTLTLPESNTSIKHHANAVNWSVGFTYTIPELPRCKIKNCKAQINHAHGDRESRSRVHPIWKKQNPGYGENNPKLIKFKWRNRKKINPY